MQQPLTDIPEATGHHRHPKLPIALPLADATLFRLPVQIEPICVFFGLNVRKDRLIRSRILWSAYFKKVRFYFLFLWLGRSSVGFGFEQKRWPVIGEQKCVPVCEFIVEWMWNTWWRCPGIEWGSEDMFKQCVWDPAIFFIENVFLIKTKKIQS